MSVTISIINVKGGVGKTLTAINLAGQMVKQNKNVLLIDNDPQSSLSQILNIKSDYTMYDLYTNNKINFEDCIRKYTKHIYVVPNSIESAVLESELHSKRNREEILKAKYQKFSDNIFNFVLIDNSPFLGIEVQNSLVMSNYYLEVIDNSTSSLQGLNMVDKIINELKENNLINELKLIGILRNNFQKRTIFSKQFDEVVEEELNDKLFKTIIYNSVKYKEASALHKTIQEYSSIHSKPYANLYSELIDRIK